MVSVRSQQSRPRRTLLKHLRAAYVAGITHRGLTQPTIGSTRFPFQAPRQHRLVKPKATVRFVSCSLKHVLRRWAPRDFRTCTEASTNPTASSLLRPETAEIQIQDLPHATLAQTCICGVRHFASHRGSHTTPLQHVRPYHFPDLLIEHTKTLLLALESARRQIMKFAFRFKSSLWRAELGLPCDACGSLW